jgi:hypothetical protein
MEISKDMGKCTMLRVKYIGVCLKRINKKVRAKFMIVKTDYLNKVNG